jgi:hypothetical protein
MAIIMCYNCCRVETVCFIWVLFFIQSHLCASVSHSDGALYLCVVCVLCCHIDQKKKETTFQKSFKVVYLVLQVRLCVSDIC